MQRFTEDLPEVAMLILVLAFFYALVSSLADYAMMREDQPACLCQPGEDNCEPVRFKDHKERQVDCALRGSRNDCCVTLDSSNG